LKPNIASHIVVPNAVIVGVAAALAKDLWSNEFQPFATASFFGR
jgi:hypothetical protein